MEESRRRSFLLPPSESVIGEIELQHLKLSSSKTANCGATVFQAQWSCSLCLQLYFKYKFYWRKSQENPQVTHKSSTGPLQAPPSGSSSLPQTRCPHSSGSHNSGFWLIMAPGHRSFWSSILLPVNILYILPGQVQIPVHP